MASNRPFRRIQLPQGKTSVRRTILRAAVLAVRNATLRESSNDRVNQRSRRRHS